MRNDKRMIASIIYIFLGAVLIGLGCAGRADEFWSGMGSALCTVGVIRLMQFFRIRKDEAYREKLEVEIADERNRFIRNKAWAWAGYSFVMIAAVSVIVFRILNQELLSMAASSAICIFLILYWGSYLILRKKY